MVPERNQPPTIELGDFRLRPLRTADAADLYAYLRNPNVTERTSFPEITPDFVETMIDRCASRWAIGEAAKWGIAECTNDRLVGTCGFNEWTLVHRRAELAYDLAHDHWGKGIARQAVMAVLAWAYRQDLIDRIQAFVRVDNRRSSHLLERCGFQHEGCLRSFRVSRGAPSDFDVYGLLRSDWEAARRSGSAGEPAR